MTEIWLRSNRRALLLGLLLPALLVLVGIGLLLATEQIYVRAAAAVLAALGVMGAIGILWQLRQPRLAATANELLVYARSGRPYRVPIDVVEGFLLGQGPTLLPGRYQRTETTTFIVRLAESAEDWAQRDIHPALGRWCGSYITLRGTWCEPLSVGLVQRLNQRLAEVQGRVAGNSP